MKGTIETIQANSVCKGMLQEQVRALLGEPAEVLTPESTLTPSQAFEAAGSMFRFNDSQLDEIWAYRHKVRVRTRFFYGFRSGRVVEAWLETLTPERAAELAALRQKA
jgi:hypothetical protein